MQRQRYRDAPDIVHRRSQLQAMVQALMNLCLHFLRLLQLMQLVDAFNILLAVLFELCSTCNTARMQSGDNTGVIAPVGFEASHTVFSLNNRGVHGLQWHENRSCGLHGHLGGAGHHLSGGWHHFGGWHLKWQLLGSHARHSIQCCTLVQRCLSGFGLVRELHAQ